MTKSGFDLLETEIKKFKGAIKDEAIKVAQAVIDEKSAEFEEELKKNTPVKTGGLRKSIVRTKCIDGNWYGYKVDFEGYAPNKEAYAKIANLLNKGAPKISGTFFVDKAVRKLKDIDKIIDARIDKMIDDRLGI